MCTSVQVKTGAIARLCKCAQGNIGKNINGHRILLISAVQGPLADLLYLSLFVCSFVRCPAQYGHSTIMYQPVPILTWYKEICPNIQMSDFPLST